jgi:hypothetical protein
VWENSCASAERPPHPTPPTPHPPPPPPHKCTCIPIHYQTIHTPLTHGCLQEEERLELFNRNVRSGAATPFDVPLPYTGASGAEVRPHCCHHAALLK